MQSKDFTKVYNALFDLMRPELNKAAGSGLLKDYSPWLHDFQRNQYSETIEIPGTVGVKIIISQHLSFASKYNTDQYVCIRTCTCRSV